MMENENILPQGWIRTTLAQLLIDAKLSVVDGPFGSDLKATEYQEQGVPILRIQNIKSFRFIPKNIKYILSDKAKQLARHSYRPGDIIITKLGDPLGEACILPPSIEEGIIVADLVRLRLDNTYIDKKWLCYTINAYDVANQLKAVTKGTTRPRVNLTHVRELEISVPPLNEQKRIVAKIEELFSELDKGIESLKTAREQLKVYRQAVLKHAFEGKLTAEWREQNKEKLETAEELLTRIKSEREAVYQRQFKEYNAAVKLWEDGGKVGKKPIKPKEPPDTSLSKENRWIELPLLPNAWAWVDLSALSIEITDGDHQPPPQSNTGVPFIVISNIRDNKIDFRSTKYVPEEYYEAISENRKPKFGDVLYTVTGSFGIPALVDFDKKFCFQRHIGLVRPISIINSKFIYYVLQNPPVFWQAQKVATGTAQKTVPLSGLRELNVPLMSITEQAMLVAEIEAKFSAIDKLETEIEASLQKSEALRQSILKKAFSGKLVAQDPNDEPASVLLERIHAEKETQASESKKPKAKEYVA